MHAGHINVLLLFHRNRIDIIIPDISDGVFFVGCVNAGQDMFSGYLQDIRVYSQSLDYV